MSNIKVECKRFGEMEGNPADSVYNIVFRDINAMAETADLKSKYSKIKVENVTINGAR